MCVCMVDVCVPGMSRWIGNCFWPKKLGSLLKEATKLSCRHFAPLEQFSQCSKCNFPSKQTSFRAIYLYGPDESALHENASHPSVTACVQSNRTVQLRSCTLNVWFETATDQTDWSNGQYFSPSCIFFFLSDSSWAHSRIMFIPITWHSIIYSVG